MTKGNEPSRRDFMRRSGALATGTWLTLNLAACERMGQEAREAAARGDAFQTLTDDEAGTLEALAGVIIPSDDGPGAIEAGAVHFMDMALSGPESWAVSLVREGLVALNQQEGGRFVDLDAAARAAAVERLAVDNPGLFNYVRYLTICGTFSHPDHGGNRNQIGWQLAGMDVLPSYQPPFGHYDASEGGEA